LTRVPSSARLRLLLADGDRLLAAGAIPAAVARYGEIVASGVEANETALARVRLLRAAAQQSESAAELQPVREALRRYVAAYPGGGGVGEAQTLLTLIERIVDPEPGEAPEFLAVELARDTLRAPTLAGHRFLEFAARHPESLFAPKALVAALPLLPERGDSLRAVLQGRYADSPYALALQGELSPAYAAAEDSLAKDLGVARQQDVDSRSLVAPPVPGPRGPWLEQVLPPGRERPPTGLPPSRRLRPGERPVQRP